MPAELEPHAGCWMVWPERPDNWRWEAAPAQAAFAAVASAIAASEPVTMAVSDAQFERCRAVLPDAVRVVEISTDDAWMRDTGPTFVARRRRRAARRRLALQRLGRPRGRPLLPLGPRRPGRRQGAGDRRRRPLPGADGARGRLDPRRRRGHGADHRGVPAQPQPQPGALPRGRSRRRCTTTSAPRRSSGSAAASSTTRPTATSTTSPASPAPASSC